MVNSTVNLGDKLRKLKIEHGRKANCTKDAALLYSTA
jgi:hypothetical protein